MARSSGRELPISALGSAPACKAFWRASGLVSEVTRRSGGSEARRTAGNMRRESVARKSGN